MCHNWRWSIIVSLYFVLQILRNWCVCDFRLAVNISLHIIYMGIAFSSPKNNNMSITSRIWCVVVGLGVFLSGTLGMRSVGNMQYVNRQTWHLQTTECIFKFDCIHIWLHIVYMEINFSNPKYYNMSTNTHISRMVDSWWVFLNGAFDAQSIGDI